jgi:hypothetical protein
MPTFVQERLELTTKQKEQVEDLQKQADRRLGQILTVEQKKQLEEMQQGLGRGGAGGFGRRGPGSDE